ncbi:type I-E CRISPR-associated protein Cse1/CasA [Sinimarinibacterium sp. NLF-5-8]|uniref:type I-E CRISPR-associated protein Cse1/CasA n=1 Tax=Sinimarinibacterium sp. NLF-5-8 TaxID=2698684 RepID=UPI00137BE386|nr:type I-E CRISPR-associated protein Cse1/CasA [Sinimarinibacterium sp. NLF-5-8]
MQNHYNLIDEPWIPIADQGRVSLHRLFNDPTLRALGGNPVQKMAVMKLLLAIAQSAYTPADHQQWQKLGVKGLAEKCQQYLQHWHHAFYLYGEQPFLQMPQIQKAAEQSYGTVQPEIATGNTTVLNQSQVERVLDDADRAMLIVVLPGFALGGKKTDNSITLSTGYTGKQNDKGKPSTGKPGPAVAHMGLLHNVLIGQNIWQSLWLNLLAQEQIENSQRYSGGVGCPPWEKMPQGEDCPVARALKNSLMGRLIPLSRFVLLADQCIHYSEGIAHANYKDGQCDPSVAVNWAGKEPKALWCNPDKRPWRELTALLSFISQQQSSGFECLQITAGLTRATQAVETFALWSGGLRVSSNAGEQYASGGDDFVESQLWLYSETLGEIWFAQIKSEMAELDELAKSLYGRVMGYFKEQLVDGKNQAALATQMYWQLCERDFQQLLDHCGQDAQSQSIRKTLRTHFARYVQQSYDHYCPKQTARQLDAWAKCRPNLTSYVAQEG